MKRPVAAALLLAFAGVSATAETAVEDGFEGALTACEEWVLNPASWADGAAPIIETVGLGDKMFLVPQVDEAALPPPPLRVANHYWRINSTPTSGFILVVSDQLPICHITGGGSEDLQPAVEAVLGSQTFSARWEAVETLENTGMVTSSYKLVEDGRFMITISRASQPGERTDRVQVLATAQYALGAE